jgi:hypothetical protein
MPRLMRILISSTVVMPISCERPFTLQIRN